MGLAATIMQRRIARRNIIRLLPGPIMDQSSNILHCRPLDLSQEGLSIITDAVLTLGDPLTLKTHKEVIHFEIVWWKPDFGKQGLFRYGLKASDPTLDLEKIFESAGCLKVT